MITSRKLHSGNNIGKTNCDKKLIGLTKYHCSRAQASGAFDALGRAVGGRSRSVDRLFALQYGLSQGASMFGPLIYLIRNAKDVRARLAELAKYFHIHSGAAQVRLDEQDEHSIISYSITDPMIFGFRHGAELALGIGISLMRTQLGKRWQPLAALMQHATVAERGQYRCLVGRISSFNAPCN